MTQHTKKQTTRDYRVNPLDLCAEGRLLARSIPAHQQTANCISQAPRAEEAVSGRPAGWWSWAYLQGLHSHCQAVLLPHAFVHLPVLASSQLVLHGDVRALHLPLVVVGGHTVDSGLVALGGWIMESGDEPVCHSRVMMNQLGQSVEAAL